MQANNKLNSVKLICVTIAQMYKVVKRKSELEKMLKNKLENINAQRKNSLFTEQSYQELITNWHYNKNVVQADRIIKKLNANF